MLFERVVCLLRPLGHLNRTSSFYQTLRAGIAWFQILILGLVDCATPHLKALAVKLPFAGCGKGVSVVADGGAALIGGPEDLYNVEAAGVFQQAVRFEKC